MLFDMGIALGEAIIANCPNLHWDVDPISAILPRQARALKRTPGMSFQRPMLTGYDTPIAGKIPLHDVYIFATQMMRNLMTFQGINRFNAMHRDDRRLIREQLLNDFKAALRVYPSGDPNKLREQVPPEDYLKIMDDLLAGEDKTDE